MGRDSTSSVFEQDLHNSILKELQIEPKKKSILDCNLFSLMRRLTFLYCDVYDPREKKKKTTIKISDVLNTLLTEQFFQ